MAKLFNLDLYNALLVKNFTHNDIIFSTAYKSNNIFILIFLQKVFLMISCISLLLLTFQQRKLLLKILLIKNLIL
jgi:hypothetical protein